MNENKFIDVCESIKFYYGSVLWDNYDCFWGMSRGEFLSKFTLRDLKIMIDNLECD